MANPYKSPFTNRISLLRDFAEEAELRKADYGRTNKFSTGVTSLDHHLGGGFGRKQGSEIVVLFGPTGVGKSQVALNMLRCAITSGKRVGILALEDEGADIFIRLTDILGNDGMDAALQSDRVHMLPPEDMVKSWKLDDLLMLIENWFTLPERDLDVILLDHLQFAFETAEAIKGENEYIRQRVFMQKLNFVMKGSGKTLLLVSHVNKDESLRGINRIAGSSGIAQAASKAIEIKPASEPHHLEMRMWKSRHTATPSGPILVKLDGCRLVDVSSFGGNHA